MVRWIAEFNKFNKYRENIPDSSIEYQFIKWKSQSNDWSNNSLQQTQEPPSKKLAIENITKPSLLQSLPENNIGEFTTFSFAIPDTNNDNFDIFQREITADVFAEPTQKNEEIAAADQIDNFIATYVDPLDMIGISELETTTIEIDSGSIEKTETPKHRGKDISMVKKLYQDEEKQAQNTNKRKRAEATVLPRLSGRPTTKDTLIKLDGEKDDLAALQLHEAELTLSSTSDDGIARKTKTIFTKCKGNITVNTQKQYLTYELFGDLRKKALETIKEQRDLLIKINAAETTMHNLLKKHNSEKFM